VRQREQQKIHAGQYEETGLLSSHTHPPAELEEPLEIAPCDWDADALYKLMTGLIVPRPIAWLSTRSPDGILNLAPHSYFNMVSVEPPHVLFSFSGVKDSLRNLRAHGEFVINMVSEDLVEPMNFTATDFPATEDEFRWADVTPSPASTVAVPRVAEALAHLEGEVRHELPVGNGHVVIGEVTHIHVDPRIWREGGIEPDAYAPVARLSGGRYSLLGEVFTLPRPRWADVQGFEPNEAMPRRPS
jgi:flavin reductase (DIM6/NTAB) family NADH-FMN oxidoreductase RutF